MFVYIIVNDVNDKIYIGKTQGPCLSRYLKQKIHDVKKGWNGVSYLYNAMKHYGSEHFHIHPLISTLATNEELCFWERVLIAQYDSQNPDIGYNICRGGEGRSGPLSLEAKAKFKEGMMKTWTDPEKRTKRLKAMKIAQSNPERRAEISRQSKKNWDTADSEKRVEMINRIKMCAEDPANKAKVLIAGRKRWAKQGMVGKVFGKLIVKSEAGRNENSQRLWGCLCACGESTIVTTNQLNMGNTKSCDKCKEGCKGLKWVHKMEKEARIQKSEVDRFIKEGWELGQAFARRNKAFVYYAAQVLDCL